MADQQHLQMPSFLGIPQRGTHSQDPVSDYLGGNASKESLQMLLNMLLTGGAAATSGAGMATGNLPLAGAGALAGVDRMRAVRQNADDASRYIGGVRGFDQSGMPGGPQTPGRFAMPGLLSD